MTEKLYYIDSHLYEFSSIVKYVEHQNENTVVVLSETAFFPEGGGQRSDTGYINGFRVNYVFEENDTVYHIVTGFVDFVLGDIVNCCIDSEIRFKRMQAHSGEHLLSGIIHSLFGADNVGFHFDDGYVMTVDFNCPLNKEQLKTAEEKANECVYKNIPVISRIYDRKELESIEFRSKLDFPGEARIVEIVGIDMCACCAPHVSSTGEIGLIKILTSQSHRGGVRITLVCGKPAYEDYSDKYVQTLNISALLCAKHSETDLAVKNLLETNNILRYELNIIQKKYLSSLIEHLPYSQVQIRFVNDLSVQNLRDFTDMLSKKSEIAAYCFVGNDDDGYSYCICSESLRLSEFVKDFNYSLSGSGGGRGTMVQGKVSSTENRIREFIESKMGNYL